MKREQLVGAEKHKDMEECVLQEKYHHVMQLVYQGVERQLPILPIGNWIAGLEKPTHRVSYTKKQLQKIENIKNEIMEYVHTHGYADERRSGMYIRKL